MGKKKISRSLLKVTAFLCIIIYMKAEKILLEAAQPGDVGIIQNRYGKVMGYATPEGLIPVEFRKLDRILPVKSMEQVFGKEEFLRLHLTEARDAVIYNHRESPQEYFSLSGILVSVLKKEAHSVTILSDVTGNEITVAPTYPLISVTENGLEELVNSIKEPKRASETLTQKPGTVTPKSKQKGGKVVKSGDPKPPSRRQIIIGLLTNGENGNPMTDAEVIRRVKEQFPDNDEKNIRNAVSVAKWDLSRKKSQPQA